MPRFGWEGGFFSKVLLTAAYLLVVCLAGEQEWGVPDPFEPAVAHPVAFSILCVFGGGGRKLSGASPSHLILSRPGIGRRARRLRTCMHACLH